MERTRTFEDLPDDVVKMAKEHFSLSHPEEKALFVSTYLEGQQEVLQDILDSFKHIFDSIARNDGEFINELEKVQDIYHELFQANQTFLANKSQTLSHKEIFAQKVKELKTLS